MKKLNTTLILCFVFAALQISGQNETDAFRYSQLNPTGTARFSSLAGSMGAFGADFSCLSSNPASIGLYKRTEFTFSPELYHSKATSTYNSSEAYDFKYNFNVGNLGAVFVVPVGKKWFVQFGTGFNRLNNYHNRYIIKGLNNGYVKNSTTSMTDIFANLSNGIADTNLTDLGFWAFNSYLIDPDTNSALANQYISHLDGIALNQRKIMESSGSLNEYVFSLGANYNDMVYIGGTIGIPFFNYSQSYTYSEKLNEENSVSNFKSLTYNESFNSQSTGINCKLGILYQPFNFLRFGIGFHTPTFYNNIREYYSYEYGAEGYASIDNSGKFDYSLTTPFKVVGDLAFIFGKYGFLNFHYNFTDYSTMQLHARDYDFDVENENIRTCYQAVHSIGAGLEINLSPVSIRLGYAYNTNPYKPEVNQDGSYHLITGGIGLRSEHFFTDFAYIHKLYYENSVLYNSSNSNVVSTCVVNQHFMFTFGIKI